MQALVEHKGKQFIVEENTELKFPYLGGNVGDKFQLEKILYTEKSNKKKFGNPYLSSLTITGEILSHGRDEKVVVFKMKRRKGYQVKRGHKQNFTLVKIQKFKNKTKKKVTSNKSESSTKTKQASSSKKTVNPKSKKESK